MGAALASHVTYVVLMIMLMMVTMIMGFDDFQMLSTSLWTIVWLEALRDHDGLRFVPIIQGGSDGQSTC